MEGRIIGTMKEETNKRHIVMVDDEPVNLELAENVLKENYKLTKLISGAQLLTFLTKVKPDMILLDVQMPEMNGYEVIEKLTSDPQLKDIPIIFLTGQDSVESERQGFSMGAKDFIRKPFDNDIMLARISSQMELYIYRNELEDIIQQKTDQIIELHNAFAEGYAEMIESRDGTTGSHVRNTTAYFGMLIRAMGQTPRFQNELMDMSMAELSKASILHDIGKISISDGILKKPGALDKEEFGEMKKHSLIGAQMIQKIAAKSSMDSFLGYAEQMAHYHHEHWDGTGYPQGLQKEEIPLYVRALSIADVYDALTSVRPYKRAFTHEEALAIITEDNGKFFDPAVYEVFMVIENQMKNYVKEG